MLGIAFLIPLLFVLGLSFATRAHAQIQQVRTLRNIPIEELGNIQVTTVEKEPEQVWQSPAAIFVITSEDIRRSGATTLPEVLRLAPGVVVNQSDSNRWAVGVRGFGDIFSKSVLVMIDGRSVYTPLVGGVHWAIQDVLLPDIERIEVIRGPGGSLWGANSVNGVINVITKRSADTHGARVTVAAGTVEHVRMSYRYGGVTRGGLGYRVYAKAFDRGPQYHADSSNFDSWRALQTGFRIDRSFGLNRSLTVSGDVYRTRTGERAEVSRYEPLVNETVDGRINLAGGNVLLHWNSGLPSGAGRMRLQVYYDHTDRDGFTFGERRDTFDADFSVRTVWRRHELAWGAGARISPSRVTQVVPTLNFVPNRATARLVSGFLHDDLTLLSNRLTLSGGLKLEHNDYTGLEVLPSARLLVAPNSRHSAWAAVTRNVRVPSRFERDLSFQVLAAPDPAVFLSVVGSDQFESERVVGSELGYRTLLSTNFYLDVTGFRTSYGGLSGLGEGSISLRDAPIRHLLLTVPFANAVDGRTLGFEVTPNWKPTSRWHLSGSYSHLRLRADNRPGFTNTALRDAYRGQSPRHQVRVQSRIDVPRGFEFDQMYRFVDELPGVGVNRYHTLDARIGWIISPRYEFFITGQNLLQPHHREFNAVPVAIRRGVYAQLVVGQ